FRPSIRHPLPGRDRQLELFIDWTQVWNLFCPNQVIPVRQFGDLHGPRRLKMKRSGSPFAPTKIKLPEPLLTTLCHEIPVHEVVRGIFIKFGQGTTIVGQDLVSEVQAENARDRRLSLADPEKPGLVRKLMSDAGEQLT